MGWMKAIYMDVEDLIEAVETDPEIDMVWDHTDARGWISPTVSELARTLINEIMERTPHDEEDIKQMERVVGMLSPGQRVPAPPGFGENGNFSTGEGDTWLRNTPLGCA